MIKYKKIYFLGAGSTYFLNMPTTKEQIALFNQESIVHDFIKENRIAENENSINSLFNILDSYLLNERVLYCQDNNKIYSVEELKNIKKEAINTIVSGFDRSTKNNCARRACQPLIDFYERLANDGLNKKLKLLKEKDCNVTGREFIVHDYAIINTNWDLWSIMPMMIAHDELNHKNNNYVSINNRIKKIRIYNDFSFFMPCNQRRSNDVWYPYNEAVCTRMNSKSADSAILSTIVKTYYPHGNMNLYKCPQCKMLTFNIGETMNMNDISLYRKSSESSCKIMECVNCGADILSSDVEMLMQTNYKIKSAYLEQIENDMRVALANTEEIIFIGYSLPNDDLDYKIMFQTLVNKDTKIKVILKDGNINSSKVFYSYKDLPSNLNETNKSTVKRYYEVFGENAEFNFEGSPECFKNGELY